ncbi:hypothetical protein GPICK_03430 [Geobacter pickeringii]|uniref:Uncharacterized protein n=1 Tax=Geobacter pickeringii TaxID=345632 RepID=A0A0B5B7J8_9BACT|nr:hypothetical protein GPICK_03430 [Geobacter pickeringii]
MLTMCREATITRHCSPTIVKHFDLTTLFINHRLDCKDQTWPKSYTATGLAKIWHLRTFMQSLADPMTNKVTNNRIPICLHMLLDSMRNI